MLNKVKRILPYSTLQSLKLGAENFEKNPPILIYTAPKTGSSTVSHSIETIGLPNSIYKIHVLSDRGIEQNVQWELSKNPSGKVTDLIILTQLLRKKIDKSRHLNVKWRIVTLTREPISRIVSSLFQGLVKGRHPNLLNSDGQLIIEDALRYLQGNFEDFIRLSEDESCWWFDTELKTMFGVDACAHPFDFEKGYITVRQGNIAVLIMRLEDVGSCLNKAITNFLNVDHMETALANITKNKKFADDYGTVQKEIKMPKALCEKIYDSKYARQFYADKRAELVEKWSGEKMCL